MKTKYTISTDTTAWLGQVLQRYTRDQLREFAKKHDVQRGRNKQDTIYNICKAHVIVDIEIELLEHIK